MFKELPGRGDGELAKGSNAVTLSGRSAQGDLERIRVKALAPTARAGARTEEPPNTVTGCLRGGRGHASVEFRKNPLKGFFLTDHASLLCDLESDHFTA